MPRMGYFISVAVAAAIAGALAIALPASAVDPPSGPEPYWSCSASVARATLLDGDPIPPVDPLGANLEKAECAEDTGGLPDIALPPPPAQNPLVKTTTAQARTQILCATDDPDPAVTPENNEDCDAGHPSYEQQVLSTANVTDTTITLGSGTTAIKIVVQAANTSARARCGPGNVPQLDSTSQVLGLAITTGANGAPPTVPFPVPVITGDPNQVIDVLGLVKITLNELVGDEGLYPDNATDGSVTRRAVHVEVPGGQEPSLGSIADVVVSESVADFHGDVCPEGKIIVKKETAPDENPNTTNFGFTATPNLDQASSAFTLTDDGSRQLVGTAPTLTPADREVLPGQYTVTENPPTGDYVLTAINCAENRSDNSTVAVDLRRANVDVGPGETVTCTFINAKPPPGVCPTGSTPNQQGQCVITTVTCPSGSTLNQQGQCVNTTVTCPTGTTGPNGQGQCVNNTLSCPAGSTQVGNQCVVSRPDCPQGSSRNPQGQCVITSVQCPAGTVFNPITLGCVEGPSGGALVPINQIAGFFRASPCIGQGFGALVGIVGTNGPDRITGTNNSDRIFALGGNDRVSGGRGDDCVEGGDGSDVIDGSNGNDVMLAGTGNDNLNGGPGRDRLEGGSGRDQLSGSNGNDVMRGGDGRDRLNGGYGNDQLFGGAGNDGISTGNGRDRVFGGTGNDIINAAIRGPAAFVDCGPGKDRVRINKNERNRVRNCEFVDITRRIRGR